MYYVGGKNRVFCHIAKYVLDGWGTRYKTYIEPFAGGCNSLQRVPEKAGCKRIGYDKNNFLISLLNFAKYVLNREEPLNQRNSTQLMEIYSTIEDLLTRDYTEDEYKLLRDIARLPADERRAYGVSDEELGFVGFIYSYRGDFFQGYTGYSENCVKCLKSFIATVQKLTGAELYCKDYREIELPNEPCIIYCDPPYKGERYVGKCFKSHWLELVDYEELYETLRYWHSLGHSVWLSEREAPEDFVPVWQKDVQIAMTVGANNRNPDSRAYVKSAPTKTETLFTIL